MLFLLILLGPAAIIAAYFIYDSLRNQGKFNLNEGQPTCSICGFNVPMDEDHPRHRQSSFSLKWTCPVCGGSTDWKGKELPTSEKRVPPEVNEGVESRSFENPLDESGKSPVERFLEEKENDEKK